MKSCPIRISWQRCSKLACGKPLFHHVSYSTIWTYLIFIIWSVNGVAPPIPTSFLVARSPWPCRMWQINYCCPSRRDEWKREIVTLGWGFLQGFQCSLLCGLCCVLRCVLPLYVHLWLSPSLRYKTSLFLISYKDFCWGESVIGPYVSRSFVCAVEHFAKWWEVGRLLPHIYYFCP